MSRQLYGHYLLSLAAMAVSPLGEAIPEIDARPLPTPPRPTLGSGCAYPSRPAPPREPTKAEVLAAERRKRKAARRIALARADGGRP